MPESTSRSLRVFLCHSSGDKPTVRELYKRLNAEGWIDAWLDDEKLFPGQDWSLEIEKAVESSDVILVCLTNNSVTKEGYVQRELRMVLDQANYKPEGTLFIIPVRLEECELPRRLRHWQSANYFPVSARDNAYARLLVSLRSRANDLEITTGRTETLSTFLYPNEKLLEEILDDPSPVEIPWTAPQPRHEAKAWHQLQVNEQENGSLTFTLISGDSLIEASVISTQRNLIDSLIREATRNPKWDQSRATSIFELIIPNKLKSSFKDIGNILLTLDPGTARWPWEILYDRRSASDAPLATQIGVIRQLSTIPTLKRDTEKNNTNVLVVGNPADLRKEFGNLPGAQQEAKIVSKKFQEYKYQVHEEIHTGASSIISRLYSSDYRVLHLTGHGAYHYEFTGI